MFLLFQIINIFFTVCFDFLVTFLLVSYSLDKYQKSLSTADMSDFIRVPSPGDKGIHLICMFCENICAALIIYLAVLTLILVFSIPICLLKYFGCGGLKALLLFIIKSHFVVLLVAAGLFLVPVIFRLAFDDDLFSDEDFMPVVRTWSCIFMVPICWCCYGYLPANYERVLAHYGIADFNFDKIMILGMFLFALLIIGFFLFAGNFTGIFSLAVSDAIKEKLLKKPVQSKQT